MVGSGCVLIPNNCVNVDAQGACTVGGGVKMRVIDLEAANFYDGFAHGNSLLNDVVGGWTSKVVGMSIAK